MTDHFEAKKHAYRQTQDGIVISFVVHPNDVSAALATASLGTRYMVAFAEIGDDDKPVSPVAQRSEPSAHNGLVTGSNPVGTTKDRKPFSSLPLPQQAALRCGDPEFRRFLARNNSQFQMYDTDMAADEVRHICEVDSRSKLSLNSDAGARWLQLEARYQQWRTDIHYAETAR